MATAAQTEVAETPAAKATAAEANARAVAAAVAVAIAESETAEEPKPSTAAAASVAVGVLCIDVAMRLTEEFGPHIKSYIAASYVQYLKGAGARVVPIWIGKPREYYVDIMTKVNGILVPGGAVYIDVSSHSNLPNECVESMRHIYEIAMLKNSSGKEYFPLWGTCLGFQLLLVHSMQLPPNVEPRETCTIMNCSLPVRFEDDFRQSRLFCHLDEKLAALMRNEPFGYHYHRYCLTKQTLMHFNVAAQWHVLATNQDAIGLEFITFIEHRSFPFYGCQVHPERVCYEDSGNPNDPCSHSEESKKAVQYLAEFFVAECRKCANHFATAAEEWRHLVDRFEITVCRSSRWKKCYLFKANPDYPGI